MQKRSSLKISQTLKVQGALIIFSVSGILTKLAAQFSFLSWEFILLYGGSMLLLLVYAFLWQQFLRKMPLTTAYSNRSVSMIWSIVWGVLIFHETVTINMIIGSAVIIFGVYMVVTADE